MATARALSWWQQTTARRATRSIRWTRYPLSSHSTNNSTAQACGLCLLSGPAAQGRYVRKQALLESIGKPALLPASCHTAAGYGVTHSMLSWLCHNVTISRKTRSSSHGQAAPGRSGSQLLSRRRLRGLLTSTGRDTCKDLAPELNALLLCQ